MGEKSKHKRYGDLFKLFIVIETIILVCAAAYHFRRFFSAHPIVIPLQKDQLEFPAGGVLKHYYFYKPHQKLVYNAPWLSHEVESYTNEDGLVDRFDYNPNPSSDVYRILAIGDSFTQGIMVPVHLSYPEVVEDMLNEIKTSEERKIEVLNFGTGGYDIDYAAYKLRTQGLKYNPDLIVWLVKFDDFYLINERMTGARASLQDELEALGAKEIGPQLHSYYYYIYNWGERMARQFRLEETLAYQKSKFQKIREQYHGSLIVVYFEDEDGMIIDFLQSFQRKNTDTHLLSLPSNISRFPDRHPNEIGYHEIAQVVSRYIIENDLIKSKE